MVCGLRGSAAWWHGPEFDGSGTYRLWGQSRLADGELVSVSLRAVARHLTRSTPPHLTREVPMYLHPDYHLKLHRLRLKECENRHRFAPRAGPVSGFARK